MPDYFFSPASITAIVCLIVEVLLLIPACRYAIKQVSQKRDSREQDDSHYRDEDGIATTQSEEAFSDLAQRASLLAISLSGSVISLVFLIGSYTGFLCVLWGDKHSCQAQHDNIWIQHCFILPLWLLLFAQACIVFRTRDSTERFRLGLVGFLQCMVLVVSLIVNAAEWIRDVHSLKTFRMQSLLVLIEMILVLTLALLFVLLPRRPDVYLDGKLVDRQFTVSALNRATFGWAGPLLSTTSRKKNISYDDLPVVSSDARASNLRSKYDENGPKTKFWKGIFWSNSTSFITLWFIQIAQSFAQFLPQVSLYFTLRALEARDAGADNQLQLWLLVVAMGVSDALFSWIESWMFYYYFIKLGTPIYEQISAIIFSKAVRKKDVKSVSGTKHAAEAQNGAVTVNEAAASKGEDTVPEEDADEGVAKTKQSTINLIGVDGKRIADFATYHSMIFGSTIKMIVAMTFLVTLVGWIPMLCGFAAFGALAPVNWYITKNYTAAQEVLMKRRDQKMAVVTEALQGIRQIKFSALESDWYDKILKTREKELSTLWRAFLLDTALIMVWIFGPICLSGICLTVYALINKQLSPAVAFTTISIFEAIEVTLAVMPELITDLFDAVVSSKRIQQYLDSPDRIDVIKPGDSILFENATVSWPTDVGEHDQNSDENQFNLHRLNLAFPSGELSVISGRTGAGKSLLLSSIIGEAELIEGSIFVPRAPDPADRFDYKANKNTWIIKEAIAFVAQIPWIENATIRDNIVFSLPFDDERYQKVVQASALQKDLEMLQDGDMTDIGANGINLSGGQKWRVSFARALYSRAGILVLDDIFSAVDAHVGKHLFEHALTGELGIGRTRILVTHHVALCLPKTAYSVVLENGSVVQAGLTSELRRHGLLKDILAYDIEEQNEEDRAAERNAAVMVDDGGSLQKTLSNRSGLSRQKTNASDTRETVGRKPSNAAGGASSHGELPKKFTEEEKREIGAVKWNTYSTYIKACGGFSYWTLILFIFILWTGVYLGRSYWISIWTRSYESESVPAIPLFQQSAQHYYNLTKELKAVKVSHGLYYYVGIYLAISLGSWLVGSGKCFFVYVASIRASKRLFEKLAFAVLRAPLRFLDTTPVGRIVNRFTADFNMVDSKIAMDITFTLHSGICAIAAVVAGVLVSPVVLPFAAVMLTVCLWYAARYLAGAREVKRLESNAKSPVFEQFGSVLTGLGTVRAFGKTEEYIQRMYQKINTHCQAYYHLWLFNRWMALRVAWTGAIFVTTMAALIVGFTNIDASLAGFALSFSLQLSESIIWMLRQYANVELDLNAVERVVEYSNMPTESQSGHSPPAAWPTKGELEVNNLVVAYAEDLAPVLKGLTFSVRQNERVGVVGRTGAGKSSLTLALFRFLEAQAGSVHIDGIDISTIKLFDLRSRLAIIPQDPVLFSGTIRSNLDPFDQHTDAELREALVRVQLIPTASAMASGIVTPVDATSSSSTNSSTLGENSTNQSIFTSLSSKISEGGLNLSQGQRQLLCLARAVVSRPKILVLDEATSSVDMETDALIQRSIREEFVESTLIVIAHRLSTIADFDRILVLGDGKVVEYDQPEILIAKEQSAFREMVESSGERKELEAVIKREKGSSVGLP